MHIIPEPESRGSTHRLPPTSSLRDIRDVLLVVKGVLYLVDLWSVETGLEYDESDVPKDTR